MGVIDTFKERWYIFIGIFALLALVLPYMQYFSIHKTDPDLSNWNYFTLLFRINNSTGFTWIFENMGSYWFIFVLSPILLITGAVLLIIAGIAKDNDIIQKILPAIGLSLVMFSVITSTYIYYIDAIYSVFPIGIRESPSRIYIAFMSFGFWLPIASAAAGAYKYLFSSKD